MTLDIAGYGFGSAEGAQSPLSMEDLLHVEQAVGWTNEDEHRLRKHAELFRSQAEQMVDSWRAVIARQRAPFAVVRRPGWQAGRRIQGAGEAPLCQWVVDVATRPHDRGLA